MEYLIQYKEIIEDFNWSYYLWSSENKQQKPNSNKFIARSDIQKKNLKIFEMEKALQDLFSIEFNQILL